MKNQHYIDNIGRILYKFIYFFIFLWITIWFNLGNYLSSKLNIKFNINLYFPSPLTSFLLGFYTFDTDQKKYIKTFDKNDINILLLGDTHSEYEQKILDDLDKYDLMIHLGDLFYKGDTKIPFIKKIDKNKLLLTIGDREYLICNLFNNNKNMLWNYEKCIDEFEYTKNEFYTFRLKLKSYSIDIFFIHNYILPGTLKYFKYIK